MKHLLLILALAIGAGAQSIETLRPTADTDSGPSCGGSKSSSTAMGNSWDAGGLATSSSNSVFAAATQPTRYKTRLFSPWAGTGNVYSALLLKVNTASGGANAGNGSGEALISYSINSGSTWTTIRSDVTGDGWAQITDTISLPVDVLPTLRVAVCASAGGDGSSPGEDNITVWDIWTEGTYSASGGPGTSSTPNAAPCPQPVLISMESSTSEMFQNLPKFSESFREDSANSPRNVMERSTNAPENQAPVWMPGPVPFLVLANDERKVRDILPHPPLTATRQWAILASNSLTSDDNNS